MRSRTSKLRISDKILLAIYELDKTREKTGNITKEEMVVKVWKIFPNDFCIKGYPQYPNADISKYVTILFKENFLKGSFYNYKITDKGKAYAESLLHITKGYSYKKQSVLSCSREVEAEIKRIKNSKVFKLFLNGETNFLESDLFEFLGTSVRSLSDSNKTSFISKYNLIMKEVIPFCKKNQSNDSEAEKIVLLSNVLIKQFGSIVSKKTKLII